MTHLWKSSGTKRTIWWYYSPSPTLHQYLGDMRNAIRYGVMKSYVHWKDSGDMYSSIDLRREMRTWFNFQYSYAKHHINPVCKSSVAILRSFRKNRHRKKYPQVKKLSMRLDSDLVKLVGNDLRITIRPGEYQFIPIDTVNKKWDEYSKHKIGEVLITDSIVAVSFSFDNGKPTSKEKIALDLNFKTIDGTILNSRGVKKVFSQSISNDIDNSKHIVKIQNDFSRRRRKIQKHVKNPKKRNRKLRETRGRQRKRITDALHKLSSKMVKDNSNSSFVLEDLTNIRKTTHPQSKKLRTYLNRWPYSQFQKMLDYKSQFKTIYVNPEGTSSRCPVCGGMLKHPFWKISRCIKCGRDYDRDRLASLAIALRGLYLCGDPFPVSAITSVPSVMDEYLYVSNRPDVVDAGGTEMVNASKEIEHNNVFYAKQKNSQVFRTAHNP